MYSNILVLLLAASDLANITIRIVTLIVTQLVLKVAELLNPGGVQGLFCIAGLEGSTFGSLFRLLGIQGRPFVLYPTLVLLGVVLVFPGMQSCYKTFIGTPSLHKSFSSAVG